MKDNLKEMISKKTVVAQGKYHQILQEQTEFFHLLNNRGYLFFKNKAAI